MTGRRARRIAGGVGVALATSAFWFGCAGPRREIDRLHRLEKVGRLDGPTLEAALAHSSPRVRAAAAAIAGRVGFDAADGLLENAAVDRDPVVRAAAAGALGRRAQTRGIEALGALARDPIPLVRRRAVQSLGMIPDPRAAGPLCFALADPDDELRRAAVEALAQIEAPESVDALIGALDDEDLQVRVSAAQTLGRLRDGCARDALERLGASSNPLERGAARRSLAALSGAECRQPGPPDVAHEAPALADLRAGPAAPNN